MANKALVIGDGTTAEYLKEKGFDVNFIPKQEATAKIIAKSIDVLAKNPNDKVVMSYSGSGVSLPVKKTRVIHMREVPPGWQSNLDYVYVGRPGKGMESQFGNPFKIGPDGDRDTVLQKYGGYIEKKMEEDTEFAKTVRDLAGRTLICFCRPKEGFQGRVMCHAQVLASKATGLPPESFE